MINTSRFVYIAHVVKKKVCSVGAACDQIGYAYSGHIHI